MRRIMAWNDRHKPVTPEQAEADARAAGAGPDEVAAAREAAERRRRRRRLATGISLGGGS